MTFEEGATLVVCSNEDAAAQLTREFYDRGLSAIGPVTTASMALTLAAAAGPRRAVLVGPTSGARDAETLAGELSRTWGVECRLFSEGATIDDISSAWS